MDQCEKRKKMLKKMKGIKDGDIQKVSVISDSKEGLEKGLSMAEKLIKKRKEMKAMNGGKKKYENGGYKLPEEVKEEADKIKDVKLMEKEESYEMPDSLKEKLKKLMKLKTK